MFVQKPSVCHTRRFEPDRFQAAQACIVFTGSIASGFDRKRLGQWCDPLSFGRSYLK